MCHVSYFECIYALVIVKFARIGSVRSDSKINRENEISRNFFKPQMLKKCLLRKKEREERLRMEMV